LFPQHKGYGLDATEDMTAWQLYKTASKVFADYLKEQKLLKHLVS
jgi:hypothetical protein